MQSDTFFLIVKNEMQLNTDLDDVEKKVLDLY